MQNVTKIFAVICAVIMLLSFVLPNLSLAATEIQEYIEETNLETESEVEEKVTTVTEEEELDTLESEEEVQEIEASSVEGAFFSTFCIFIYFIFKNKF